MAAEPRVLVPCQVCKIEFDVSARTARNIAGGRSLARCTMHRERKPRPATVQASHRRYWLQRFSLEEIADMAHAIFDDIRPGEPHASPALMALANQVDRVTPTMSERALDPALVARARTARRHVASGR